MRWRIARQGKYMCLMAKMKLSKQLQLVFFYFTTTLLVSPFIFTVFSLVHLITYTAWEEMQNIDSVSANGNNVHLSLWSCREEKNQRSRSNKSNSPCHLKLGRVAASRCQTNSPSVLMSVFQEWTRILRNITAHPTRGRLPAKTPSALITCRLIS